MNIRHAEERDTDDFAQLIHEVESTTNFMLFGPGERKFNPEAQRKMIQTLRTEENSNIFLAEAYSGLAGYLIAKGGSASRTKHTAYLVIGIMSGFRGSGIGTRLFEELFSWGKEVRIHRLELTVMTENKAGIALYRKMGFEIEGTKKDSLLVDGQYKDEFYMSRIL
ncbi:GNAT family N-acetyltransferase [Bacillus sp. ISL-37]|jgi:RimJ/RimL family protein N-acetyltransferase|uniref:GNAT family N-acetyltransferase n=1 Tax=Bacillus sp. ISL-37 TaxID=2819123 RepID=UPI001BECD9DB|nr:GNAT family N-acetyltransferase [Bacillus sp. ISL-37]MBT2683402.1 GNAT family N-acetyltransferase [Bacillus sp. ISL-37]